MGDLRLALLGDFDRICTCSVIEGLLLWLRLETTIKEKNIAEYFGGNEDAIPEKQ